MINYLILLIVFIALPANAYVGLGPLSPMLGGIMIYIIISLITIIGIFLYPFKILISKIKKNKNKKV